MEIPRSIRRITTGVALVGAGFLGAYLLNNCEGNRKTGDTIINNYECCKEEVKKPVKPKKQNQPSKKQKKQEIVIDDIVEQEEIVTPKAEDCFEYKKIPAKEDCLDYTTIYNKDGVEFQYIGAGSFTRNKKNIFGKMTKKTETVPTNKFRSLDGTQTKELFNNQLETWDDAYKLQKVRCNTSSIDVEVDLKSQNTTRNEKQNRRQKNTRNDVYTGNQYIANQGAVNPVMTNVSIVTSGRNGMFALQMGNMYGNPMMMPGMNGRVIGYNPTGYIVPVNGMRMVNNVELQEQIYNPEYTNNNIKGRVNARMTTMPNPAQRAINSAFMYSNR